MPPLLPMLRRLCAAMAPLFRDARCRYAAILLAATPLPDILR